MLLDNSELVCTGIDRSRLEQQFPNLQRLSHASPATSLPDSLPSFLASLQLLTTISSGQQYQTLRSAFAFALCLRFGKTRPTEKRSTADLQSRLTYDIHSLSIHGTKCTIQLPSRSLQDFTGLHTSLTEVIAHVLILCRLSFRLARIWKVASRVH